LLTTSFNLLSTFQVMYLSMIFLHRPFSTYGIHFFVLLPRKRLFSGTPLSNTCARSSVPKSGAHTTHAPGVLVLDRSYLYFPRPYNVALTQLCQEGGEPSRRRRNSALPGGAPRKVRTLLTPTNRLLPFFCWRAALDVPKEPDRPKPNPATQPIGISREGAPRSPRSCSGHA
jgi:hypothetical protein